MKNKKIILIISVLIFAFTISSYVIYNSSNKVANTKAKDIKEENLFKDFKDLNLQKEKVNLFFEGKAISLKMPIYVLNNRYYIPIEELLSKLDGNVAKSKNNIEIKLKYKTSKINTKDNTYKKQGKNHKLTEKCLKAGNIHYISLVDFTNMLDLVADWNYKNKEVKLFFNKNAAFHKNKASGNKTALLRLEDIGPGGRYRTSESLQKLRIIGDFLYSKNIPFHIAWVPRYVSPKNKYDNSLADYYSIENVDFLYTLDYLRERGGLIGVHGYTHQSGEQESMEGIEFSSNTSSSKVEERIKQAILASKKLNIPIYFFESPHYSATLEQRKVIGQHFKYLYETREKNITQLKACNGSDFKIVPAPLNYVDGANDTENMISKINSLDENTLASFFYHANIEFPSITISKDKNGYPNYIYSNSSPLHKIVNALENKRYKFKKINSL